jgi:hypothetical protein
MTATEIPPVERAQRPNVAWRDSHDDAEPHPHGKGDSMARIRAKGRHPPEKQEMQEKRRLLDFVCSNSTDKNGRLIPQYRKPFDLLAVTNMSYQQTKIPSPEESGLCPSWLPMSSGLQTITISLRIASYT